MKRGVQIIFARPALDNSFIGLERHWDLGSEELARAYRHDVTAELFSDVTKATSVPRGWSFSII